MRPTFGLRPLTSPFRQVYIVPICILCEPIASNKTIYHYSHFTHFTLIKQSLLTGEGRRDKRTPDAITNWDFPYANLNVLNEYFFLKDTQFSSPNIAQQCPSLNLQLTNALSSLTHKDGRAVGSIYTFSCPPGYELSGSPILLCGGTQTWSSGLPTCTREFALPGLCT